MQKYTMLTILRQSLDKNTYRYASRFKDATFLFSDSIRDKLYAIPIAIPKMPGCESIMTYYRYEVQ